MHPSSPRTSSRRTSRGSSSRRRASPQIRQPGQFVIVRLGPGAERIPLTIADADAGGGHHHASSSRRSARAPPTSSSSSRATRSPTSPGRSASPTELHRARPRRVRRRRRRHGGHPAHRPGARTRRGVAVTSVIGGRSREWVILEDGAARGAARSSPAPTTAATAGPGFVTEALARRARRRAAIDAVYAVGPVPDDAGRRRADPAATACRPPSRSTRSWSTAPACAAAAASRSAARRATPASTARSSTATRSTSAMLADRLTHLPRRSSRRAHGAAARRAGSALARAAARRHRRDRARR